MMQLVGGRVLVLRPGAGADKGDLSWTPPRSRS